MMYEDEPASLTAENARQREQIAELVARNAALAARIQGLEACRARGQPQQKQATRT